MIELLDKQIKEQRDDSMKIETQNSVAESEDAGPLIKKRTFDYKNHYVRDR
jgi:hypothetical protein